MLRAKAINSGFGLRQSKFAQREVNKNINEKNYEL